MRSLVVLFLFTLSLFASNGFISVKDLQKKLADKNLVILDVTDYATYKKGHINSAVLADISNFRETVNSYQIMKSPQEIEKQAKALGINNDSEIIIYGHGKPKELLKESYLALALIVNGAKNISILNGGYLAWTFESNLLSSTTITKSNDGNFTAVYNPNILVNLDYVKKRLYKTPMLDARSTEFYYGTDLSNGVTRVGHISGAMSSFWKDKFLTDETTRNDDELSDIFLKGYNLNPNDEVILYCTGGLEASMNWYILYNHMGFKNAKLYDASMREWGNMDDTPMTRFKWEVFNKK